MSMSNAGANKSRQLIAYVGPWSSVNDDYGPFALPTGFSKARFSTEGAGSGYTVTIYDGVSFDIEDAIYGKWNPSRGARLSPHPPPQVPNAAYGALLAIPETSWAKTVGPSSQAGTGVEANPLVTNGTQSQILISSYPIYYVRAKVTAIAGATGVVSIYCVGIP
jgi:hypothetical protein